MTEEIKVILKFITFFVVGFFVNYGMTRLAAPEYSGTALAVGLFLTTFGMVLAISAMQFVMVPLGIFKFIRQLSRGEKPIKSNPRGDRLDHLGRLLFVFLYAMLSTIIGVCIGILTGGMGFLTTAAMFMLAGIALSLFAPMDLVWNADVDVGATGIDETQRTDIDEARKQGDPSILFVDKTSKRIIDTLVELPPPNDKPDQR